MDISVRTQNLFIFISLVKLIHSHRKYSRKNFFRWRFPKCNIGDLPGSKAFGSDRRDRKDPGLSLLRSPGNPDKNGAPRPKMSVWSPDKLT